MADTKLSALTAQTAAGLAIGDQLLTLDVSDTTMGAGGTDKRIPNGDFIAGMRSILCNQSVSSQTGFSSDTYLVGSNVAIPSGYPIVGTTYKLVFDVTKTNVGTATPIITVRIGTGGVVGDAAICAFTFGAGTTLADTGIFEVIATFRTVGSSTSAVLQGIARLNHNAAYATGISNAVNARATTSSGFNSTTAGSIIGTSYNGGASAAHTIQLVRAELVL